MQASFENATIVTPVIDNSEFASKCIRFHLENSPMNIIVLYDQGTPEDYVIDERVTYVKNQAGRHFPKILNQLIKACPTEYVVYVNWRYRPTHDQHLLAFQKLNEGYGCVDLSGPLQYTAFSKHLISIIGFFDERFVGGHCVDWDIMFNLFYHDIAHYNIDVCYGDFSLGTPTNPTYTTWKGDCGNRENYLKFEIKWKEYGTELKRIMREVNAKDKDIYKGVYENRAYKPYLESVLDVKWVKDRMVFKTKK